MYTDKHLQFTDLIQKHRGVVYGVLVKNVTDKNWHDDLYQDIILRAWEAYDSFKGISQFSSWLHSIAHNTTIDRLRRLKVQSNRIAQYNWFYEYTTSVIDQPYEEKHLPIIDTLSDIEKRTLQMRLDGLSFTQMSEITNEPENRLRIRMHRIKERLSKHLKQ